jgi:hypothetical protein
VTVVVSSRREEFEVDARGKRIRSSQAQQGQGQGSGKRPPAIFDNESICVLEVCGG